MKSASGQFPNVYPYEKSTLSLFVRGNRKLCMTYFCQPQKPISFKCISFTLSHSIHVSYSVPFILVDYSNPMTKKKTYRVHIIVYPTSLNGRVSNERTLIHSLAPIHQIQVSHLLFHRHIDNFS